jgi:transketolase
MALASKMMAAKFNTAEHKIIDHNVISLVSDGDLMEGISSEASSIAGHLKLSNLIYIYDDNKISIDGCTDLTFTEDVAKRYEAYGWYVQKIDGHNHEEIRWCDEKCNRRIKERPSLIVATTNIACGSPNKQGKASSHGAPLAPMKSPRPKPTSNGVTQKHFMYLQMLPNISAPKWRMLVRNKKNGKKLSQAWSKANPELAKTWNQMWNKEIPAEFV